MSLQTTYRAWKGLSTLKRSAIAVALILGLLVTGYGAWSVAGWFTGRHDREFDEERAAEAAQRQVLEEATNRLTVERDAAIAEAVAAEKVVEDMKAEIAIKETALAAAGPKIQEANRKLIDEDQRYTEALANSGRDIDPRARCLNNCNAAKRLRIKPESAICDCED